VKAALTFFSNDFFMLMNDDPNNGDDYTMFCLCLESWCIGYVFVIIDAEKMTINKKAVNFFLMFLVPVIAQFSRPICDCRTCRPTGKIFMKRYRNKKSTIYDKSTL